MSFYKLSNDTLVSAISVLVKKTFTKNRSDVHYFLTDFTDGSSVLLSGFWLGWVFPGFPAFSFDIIVAMSASLAFFNMASSQFFGMSMSEASECSTVCNFIFSVSWSALSDFTSKCESLQEVHTQKDISKASFSLSSTQDK